MGTTLTALAPTDAAFQDFATRQNVTVEELLASPIVTPLLQYHLIPGALSVADLHDGQSLETMLADLPLNVTLPPSNLPRTLGIESFNFVTIHGAANDALIVTQDLQAGQVSLQFDLPIYQCTYMVCMLITLSIRASHCAILVEQMPQMQRGDKAWQIARYTC